MKGYVTSIVILVGDSYTFNQNSEEFRSNTVLLHRIFKSKTSHDVCAYHTIHSAKTSQRQNYYSLKYDSTASQDAYFKRRKRKKSLKYED